GVRSVENVPRAGIRSSEMQKISRETRASSGARRAAHPRVPRRVPPWMLAVLERASGS
ncbi:hypothetical protein P7K49_008787, partial [Saguinus oedipus]